MKFILVFLIIASSLFANVYLDISGNQIVKTDTILQVGGISSGKLGKLWTQKITFADEQEIIDFKDRLVEYYHSIGYYLVSIDVQTANDEQFTLLIKEGAPVRISQIVINSPAPLDNIIGFKKGDIFATQKFIDSKANIKKQFDETGYPTAELSAKAIVNIEEYTCVLVYKVDNYVLTRFGKTNIKSDGFVSAEAVKRYLAFKEGQVYDSRKLERSRQALYNLNIFTDVSMDANFDTTPIVPIDINLSKGKSRSWGASFGYDTDEGYILRFFWENRNWLGDVDTLRTSAIKTGVRSNAGISYDRRLDIGKFDENLFIESINYPGYRQNHIQNYPKLTFPIGVTSHQIGFKTDDGYVIPSTATQYIIAQNYFINAPTYRYTLDKRNSKIDATDGYFFSGYSEITSQSLGSSLRYLKLVGDTTYTKEPISDLVLFGRCKVGMINDYEASAVPVFERFFAGGVNSNRGYHWRMLGPSDGYGHPIGGQSIVDGSIEARIKTVKSLWGVIFWDMTQLNYQSMSYNQGYKNSVGFGMRYETPIGPIRIDIGVPINEQSHYPVLNIAVGQVF